MAERLDHSLGYGAAHRARVHQHSRCRIAKTGSIVFGSSSRSPASLNYLPDLEIALLSKSDILAHPEDVWRTLREMHGASATTWPRAVNVVSGASRTADIAGILVRPAHGPKHVHIILTP